MIGEISVNQRRAVDDDVIIYLQFQDLKTDLELKSLPANVKKKLDYKIKRLNFQGKEGQTLILEEALDNTAIALLGGGKKQEFNWVKLRDNLANFLRQLNHLRYRRLSLKLRLFKQENYFEVGKQLALAFYLSNYRFLYFKNEEERKKAHYWQSLTVLLSLKKDDSQKLKLGFAYGREISRGIFFARDLVNQPASHITPTSLMEHAFALEKTAPTKIKVEVLDVNECQKLGMGAYLSVGQGSDQPPKFIILHYKPSNAVVKHKVCLIGKSLTFDSGGISLKPAAGMEEMKSDMAGGATVLGIFQVLIANSDYFNHLEVWGILPACENMPSGKAIKPGDIVTACNGKTIEVINTDAEGRLTLADALAYAQKSYHPDIIIDLATLTGACIVALGKKIAAVFGNYEKTLRLIEQIAAEEGESLWPLPLYRPYSKIMKSEIADLKNVSNTNAGGGAITAALFLAEFVDQTNWLHFDIAGPSYNNASAEGIMPHGGTGWGIITLLEFLKRQAEN